MLVCKNCGKIIANVNPYKTNYGLCCECHINEKEKELNSKRGVK